MIQNPRSLKVIIIGLILVYGLSFAVYASYLFNPPVPIHTPALTTLFAFLAIGSFGAVGLKEWGRQTLVLGNIAMLLYLVGVYFLQREMIYLSYMFMNLITVLLFSQEEARFMFVDTNEIKRRSVLIVDDDAALLKTIKPILLSNGFSVLSATTGEKGLQIATRQKPDVIILDVILPGIKGRQVCSKLKDNPETHKIPVIFLTAKDSPDDVKAEMAVGAISHITKPFSPQKLLDEIKKAIGP